jgi:hypothetical protein
VWKWQRSYSYSLIDASGVVENLSAMADKTELTEGLVRPLTKLDTPEEQREAFRGAQRLAAQARR